MLLPTRTPASTAGGDGWPRHRRALPRRAPTRATVSVPVSGARRT